MGAIGTQTAAVSAGGDTHPDDPRESALVEEWDGSSWSEVTNVPAVRRASMGGGTLTAGLVSGGYSATATFDSAFEYDGTNWTAGGTMLLGQSNNGGGGTQTSTISAGGGSPLATCQTYDGTSWYTSPSLATGRELPGSGGGPASTAALNIVVGGDAPPLTNATEEFTGETTAINLKTITDS